MGEKKKGKVKIKSIAKLNILNDVHFLAKEFYVSSTIGRTTVYPRATIEKSLKVKAYRMILAHNHPNGKLQSSNPDINITKIIEIAAKSIGMVLYDHLIVSSTGYFSFRKERLL